MRAKGLLIALLAVGLAAACASGPSKKTSGQSTSAAATVHLTYWSWAPNMDQVVNVWNKSHPTIQVTISKQSGGDQAAAKFLTAAKAGNPPDLMQAEYQALPSFVASDALADIGKYVGSVRSEFPSGLWNLVTLGSGAVYGVPQDSSPMMLYYRTDLFKKYGLAVPTTWDQYAAEAKTLRTKTTKAYLGGFDPADPGWFAGLAQQAGAQWWSISGDTWKVDVADAATQKVATYWGNLVKQGLVDSEPGYTPAWNKALNDGSLLTWPSAVWGPGVLSGSAPAAKGKWAIAPLPQWNAGESKSGFWGGSSTAVAAKSPHVKEAAQFAAWLNTDPRSVDALVKQAAIYPASVKGQAALSTAPDYFSNQPEFYQLAAKISQSAAGFTFGPNVGTTYSAWTDAFGQAAKNKSDFAAALQTVQSKTVADMKSNGFKVG